MTTQATPRVRTARDKVNDSIYNLAHRAEKKAWRKAHPKNIAISQAKYAAANTEKLVAYHAAYNLANRKSRATKSAAYRASHREEIAARARAWGAANRERITKVAAMWRSSNQDKVNAAAARYAATHQEEINARSRAYGKTHPEGRRAAENKRRARLSAMPSERVLISVLFERDHGVCGICGKRVYKNARDLQMRPSHDHVLPVSHGGANTYANSRLVHRRCNSARGNRGTAQLRMVD